MSTREDFEKRLILSFNRAFQQLSLNISDGEVRSLVNMIYQAMTGEGRYYHTPEHALALTDTKNPLQTLAALFHDVVYYQVDQGFSPEIWKTLEPYIQLPVLGEEGFRSVGPIPQDDFSFHMVSQIFGFPAGQNQYSTACSNEFLSSLVMAKKLEKILTIKILMEVSAYIEATIPFRPAGEDGDNPFERLADRLVSTAQLENIHMSTDEIVSTIQGAVSFANRDVDNFTRDDPALFLESTWTLLPESNPAIRKGSIYMMRDHRQALNSMVQFLVSIRPEDVLHRYKNVPTEQDIQEKLVKVIKNLAVSRAYLDIKLLTAAIIESLAEVSGGDAPVSSLIGDVQRIGDGELDALRSILPTEAPAEGVDLAGDLYRILVSGVKGPVDYTDLRTAPIAAYIFSHSGPKKVNAYLATAVNMFAGKITPVEFLQHINASTLAPVAETISLLAEDRREMLTKFAREIVQP